MALKSKKSKKSKARRRVLGRPGGVIQPRVQKVGPDRFAVIVVDCAKLRCKWMLCDFYGHVIVEPTTVDCNRTALRAMTLQARAACDQAGIVDSVVAVEMTGVYHKPVVRAFRDAGFETRMVHPHSTKHYAAVSHPDLKTDDNDLEAIFQATCQGFGLTKPEVDKVYPTLQAISRHRRNLVQQRARLQSQIRVLLHQTMPGFADLFSTEKLFNTAAAIDIARDFKSPKQIVDAALEGLTNHLKKKQTRFRRPTLERILAWAGSAEPGDPLAEPLHAIWCELDELREKMSEQIQSTERKMAEFLGQTPYVLLLSVSGINVVTAAELAGEAGPIELYPSAEAIKGRAGLYPSRYQSDAVDYPDGELARRGNHRLRAALMRMAGCLIDHHPQYRGLSEKWKAMKVDPCDRHCRVANRAVRMIFQVVSGRQVYRRRGIDRQYLMSKLLEFHRRHESTPEQIAANLQSVFSWLPKSSYLGEGSMLAAELKKRRKKVQSLGELLVPLMLRLGVANETEVESKMSEARG